MKIFLLIMILQLLISCASHTSNKEAKKFDADSSYCNQLRQGIFQANAHSNKLNQPGDERHQVDALSKFSNAIDERDRKIFFYEKDCESKAAFNSRKRDNDFKYEKNDGRSED